MKKILIIPIFIGLLSLAFVVISILVVIFGEKNSLIKKKLRIGGVLLMCFSIYTAGTCKSDDQLVVMCYDTVEVFSPTSLTLDMNDTRTTIDDMGNEILLLSEPVINLGLSSIEPPLSVSYSTLDPSGTILEEGILIDIKKSTNEVENLTLNLTDSLYSKETVYTAIFTIHYSNQQYPDTKALYVSFMIK